MHQALCALREPAPPLSVTVDAYVAARFEHDLEIPAIDRVVGPPAVDDTPFLPHDDDELTVDEPWLTAHGRLDEGRAWRVQPARDAPPERARSAGTDGVAGCAHRRERVGRVLRAISRCPPAYTSRGTTSALVSGIRDHGATSTTLPTAPPPALART